MSSISVLRLDVVVFSAHLQLLAGGSVQYLMLCPARAPVVDTPIDVEFEIPAILLDAKSESSKVDMNCEKPTTATSTPRSPNSTADRNECIPPWQLEIRLSGLDRTAVVTR